MEILHRDDLPLSGFAGLREHRLVMGSKIYSDSREPGTWEGIGHFVYLADARFIPKGETRLHRHREMRGAGSPEVELALWIFEACGCHADDRVDAFGNSRKIPLDLLRRAGSVRAVLGDRQAHATEFREQGRRRRRDLRVILISDAKRRAGRAYRA